MGLFSVSENEKLALFRKHFIHLTSDGTFPPERQQQLFQWCQKCNLDWNKARLHVLDRSHQLIRHYIKQIIQDRQITPIEVTELRRLQRRLGLTDQQALLDDFYALVQQKVTEQIVERAAYLGSAPAVAALKDELADYHLPLAIEQRLTALLDQQHRLASLVAGTLPIIRPSVTLHASEACHFEAQVSFLCEQNRELSSGNGLLLVTSQRVLLLSPIGGAGAIWNDIRSVRFRSHEWLEIRFLAQTIALIHADAQFVSTLLVSAFRKYRPNLPVPVAPNKRLA